MAESTRGTPGENESAREVRATTPPRTMDPERLLPEEAEAAHGIPDYDDPEAARSHIEATRSRMSSTIDEIEERILRKKQHVQDRLDVTAPVRANPWRAMGIALGSGFLLGILTADREEIEERPEPRRRARGTDRNWKLRAHELELRSRRLLRIAREQEEEIERMRRQQSRFRGGRAGQHAAASHPTRDDEETSTVSRFDEVRDAIVAQIGDFLGLGSRG